MVKTKEKIKEYIILILKLILLEVSAFWISWVLLALKVVSGLGFIFHEISGYIGLLFFGWILTEVKGILKNDELFYFLWLICTIAGIITYPL